MLRRLIVFTESKFSVILTVFYRCIDCFSVSCFSSIINTCSFIFNYLLVFSSSSFYKYLLFFGFNHSFHLFSYFYLFLIFNLLNFWYISTHSCELWNFLIFADHTFVLLCSISFFVFIFILYNLHLIFSWLNVILQTVAYYGMFLHNSGIPFWLHHCNKFPSY